VAFGTALCEGFLTSGEMSRVCGGVTVRTVIHLCRTVSSCASCGRRLSKVAPLTEAARTSSPVPIPSGAVVLASIPSATLHGVDGRRVSVEVHVSSGLPGFTVVGLPDAAVRESRDRVRAALLSSQLSWPSRRVTVNLAPSRYRLGKPDRAVKAPPARDSMMG